MMMKVKKAIMKMKHALVAWKLKHKQKLVVVVEEVEMPLLVDLQVVLQSVVLQVMVTVALLVVVVEDNLLSLLGH
jgi:hypothetical protein